MHKDRKAMIGKAENEMMHKDRRAMIDKPESEKRKVVKGGKMDAGGRDCKKRDIMRGSDSVGSDDGGTQRRSESSYYRGEYGNAGGRRERIPGQSHWSPRGKYSSGHGEEDEMGRKDFDRKDLQYGRLRSLSPPKEPTFKRGRKDSWRGPAWR